MTDPCLLVCPAEDALATTRLGITLRGFRRLQRLLVDSLTQQGFDTVRPLAVFVGEHIHERLPSRASRAGGNLLLEQCRRSATA